MVKMLLSNKKSVLLQIKSDIFPYDFLFLFGANSKACKKKLRKHLSREETAKIPGLDEYLAFTLNYDSGVSLVRMDVAPKSTKDISVLSHEIVHAVCNCLSYAGVSLVDESEEVYAYLVSSLLRTVLESLDKVK